MSEHEIPSTADESESTDHKYSTGSSDETRSQWTEEMTNTLIKWDCKPFNDMRSRHATVHCKLVVKFTPDIGLDVMLEARSDDTDKIPDEWTPLITIEGRDGMANYTRKPQAKWLD